MMHAEEKNRSRYFMFRRISAYGGLILLLWISLGGSIMTLGLDTSVAKWGPVVAALLLIASFTPPFRDYVKNGMDNEIYPIMILIGYILLTIMYAYFLCVYIRDPSSSYNPYNKSGLLLWSVATPLLFLVLVASAIAYLKDRRTHRQGH
jgi:hypothetical protein